MLKRTSLKRRSKIIYESFQIIIPKGIINCKVDELHPLFRPNKKNKCVSGNGSEIFW